MIYIVLGLMIIVGLVVIYLSLSFDNKEHNNDFDYTKTDFIKELEGLDIKKENIIELKSKIAEYIIGMDNLVNSIIVSILADDHILVEGVPGLAKTRTILVFSRLLGLKFKRIQFTPDMLPSDIIGGEIYNKNTGKFEIYKGPIFTNLLLADEINRATPKVQSALLEAMQERKVTIGNTTFELEKPFFVMATQNPLEQEGTFPLPEAQLDRFLFKVVVSYPSKEEEIKVLDSFNKNLEDIEQLISKEELLKMQDEIKNIFIPDNVKKYIVDIVNITREKDEYIEVGASTRAIISISKSAKVLAYLQEKNEVSIDDVKKVALLTLRHRVKLSYKATVEGKSVEEIIVNKLLKVKDI